MMSPWQMHLKAITSFTLIQQWAILGNLGGIGLRDTRRQPGQVLFLFS